MPGSSDFQAALAFGKEGEREVAERLIARGGVVLPLYQFDQHSMAPRLFSAHGNLVSPDLIHLKDGRCHFVEVKRKQQWVQWDGRLETGFDLCHYRQYIAATEASGVPVWVFFKHENEPPLGIFCGDLAQLSENVREWDGMSPSGKRCSKPLALFPRETLKVLA